MHFVIFSWVCHSQARPNLCFRSQCKPVRKLGRGCSEHARGTRDVLSILNRIDPFNHSRARARARTRAHTRTHTHTHTQNVANSATSSSSSSSSSSSASSNVGDEMPNEETRNVKSSYRCLWFYDTRSIGSRGCRRVYGISQKHEKTLIRIHGRRQEERRAKAFVGGEVFPGPGEAREANVKAVSSRRRATRSTNDRDKDNVGRESAEQSAIESATLSELLLSSAKLKRGNWTSRQNVNLATAATERTIEFDKSSSSSSSSSSSLRRSQFAPATYHPWAR